MIAHRIKEIPEFEIFSLETSSKVRLPLFLSRISAGFPSPAEDYVELSLDLNEHLIKHKKATYCLRVNGNSMEDANINNGDIIIIDRALDVKNNDIIVCQLDSGFTVKRYHKENDCIILTPANNKYNPIKITKDQQFEIFGKVTYIIHKPK